jgi:hemolysin activation/secretion protein
VRPPPNLEQCAVRCALVAAGLHVVSLGSASAQAPPTPPPAFEAPERPGERALGSPPAPLEEKESTSLTLPPLPQPNAQEGSPLSDSPRVVVQNFRIVGSTVFSQAELARVAAPYLGRALSSEDLLALRDALTALYLRAGYVTSGALLPDQEVREGVVEYAIVEGRLASIEIEGEHRLRESYVVPRLRRGAREPLDVLALERELQLLLQDPRVERVDAALSPGERPGEARLWVRIDEANPCYALGAFDNYESPSVGAMGGELELGHRNLTGRGDTLHGAVSGTRGLLDWEIGYELPLTRWDTALGVAYRRGESDVVEAPFDAVDITSNSRTIALTLRQPLYRSRSRQLDLALVAEHRESETFLLGEPFSFSPGPHAGRSRVAVLRVRSDFVQRDARHAIALRSQLSFGLDALGATKNAGGVPDGQFFAWLAQLQGVRRWASAELLARFDIQLASRPLLSLEQFPVGGHASVRGYRESQLVRDDGLSASLELRVPLWRRRVDAEGVQLAVFADIGHSWNPSRAERAPRTLVSLGGGLRVPLARWLRGEIYWAEALRDVPAPVERDAQDSGLHFRLTASL